MGAIFARFGLPAQPGISSFVLRGLSPEFTNRNLISCIVDPVLIAGCIKVPSARARSRPAAKSSQFHADDPLHNCGSSAMLAAVHLASSLVMRFHDRRGSIAIKEHSAKRGPGPWPDKVPADTRRQYRSTQRRQHWENGVVVVISGRRTRQLHLYLLGFRLTRGPQ